jgi:hypothetical protein
MIAGTHPFRGAREPVRLEHDDFLRVVIPL